MIAAGPRHGGRGFVYSVPWNLLLITSGSLLFAVAIKGIAEPHGFIPAGLFGVSILLERLPGTPGAGLWYLLLNLPLFAVAWLFIGRRFLLYSLVAMLVTALSYSLLRVDFGIQDQLYAAVTCGALSGAGAGIVLRSLGSNGGLDVVGVILWQRYNIGLGKFYFAFNFLLFSASLLVLEIDLIIASLILVFVSSVAVEYCLSFFSQRKVAMIISPRSEEIAEDILQKLKIGATFLEGRGAMGRERKQVLLAVINNIQLKRLEELVFTRDPHALMIIENTFMVIGSTFSQRKIY
ncbi:MAG: YitT family protein [Desulfuromonadales bacterium]|nr:YitT family protein [Desulfuromonadales bacterium]